MITSKNTSINKNKVPILFSKVDKYFGWKPGSMNLDIGGGAYDSATKFLKKKKVTNFIYDPFNRSDEHNLAVRQFIGHAKAESVTLSNVLNVIESTTVMKNLLKFAKKNMEKEGVCYITCYNSKKKGISKKDCYQQGEPLSWYLPLVQEVFPAAEIRRGVIVAKN